VSFGLASEDMPEFPLDIMNIPCNKLLSWRLLCEILQTTQRGEDALGSTTGHGEAAMRAGVARSQRLAEVIRRLLAHDSHLRGQVRVVLLLWVERLQRHLRVHFVRLHIRMHCDIMELADQLRRQVGVVGDVPVDLLVRRRCHLLTVALREVDDAGADGGEADERAGARVPQLRVKAPLLLARLLHGRRLAVVFLLHRHQMRSLSSRATSSTNAQGFQLADHGGAPEPLLRKKRRWQPGEADEQSTSGPASARATTLSAEDNLPPQSLLLRLPEPQETTKSRRRRGGERERERKKEADGGGGAR